MPSANASLITAARLDTACFALALSSLQLIPSKSFASYTLPKLIGANSNASLTKNAIMSVLNCLTMSNPTKLSTIVSSSLPLILAIGV